MRGICLDLPCTGWYRHDPRAAIPAVVDAGLAIDDDEIGAAAPAHAHAIGSALHETQYSRIFRS